MNGRHRQPRTPHLIACTLAVGALAGGCASSSTPTPASSATATPAPTSTPAPTTKPSPLPPSTGNVALDVPVSGSGGFNYTQGTYLEGFEFTANQPISVTALGAYDSNLSSLPSGKEKFATVPVALYDLTTHTQLASVQVSASSAPTGVYRYATLASPIALNTTDKYAVAWVSLTNNYVASPKLAASDVSTAITYLAMVGNGDGGLTTTGVMVEPNWFFTTQDHGIAAVNYDLGPNFIFSAP